MLVLAPRLYLTALRSAHHTAPPAQIHLHQRGFTSSLLGRRAHGRCTQFTAQLQGRGCRRASIATSEGSSTSATAPPSEEQPRQQQSQRAVKPNSRHAPAIAFDRMAEGSGRPVGSKRTCALHVGYVGTAFKGLQVSKQLSVDQTVEGVLERALLHAGFIAPSNYGDLFKVRWNRSSRTDKGVHSLSTVISLRMLLPEGDLMYEDDPEGISLATAINKHLPPTVRVFSVQRVQKKFNARRTCTDRSYEYFLPAHLLGLSCGKAAAGASVEGSVGGESVGGGSVDGASASAGTAAPGPVPLTEEDKEILERFRAVLAAFVGTHAFHNYTPAKRLYNARQKQMVKRQAREAGEEGAPEATHAAAAAAAPAAAPAPAPAAGAESAGGAEAAAAAAEPSGAERAGSGQVPTVGGAQGAEGGAAVQAVADGSGQGEPAGMAAADGEGERGGAQGQRGRGRGKGGGRGGRKARDDDSDGEDERDAAGSEEEEEEEGAEEEEPQLVDGPEGTKVWPQSCYWVGDGPQEGAERIVSQHFRTMMSWSAEDPRALVPGGVPCLRLEVRGTSFMLHQIRHMIGAAVAVARGLLTVELIHASITTPCRMTVPRAPPHTLLLGGCSFMPFRQHEQGNVTKLSGDVLQLREQGQEQRAEFQAQVLDSALNDLLSHPDWGKFDTCLSYFSWPEEGKAEVLGQHRAWVLRREEIAKRRKAEAQAVPREAEGRLEEDGVGAEGVEGPEGEERAGRGRGDVAARAFTQRGRGMWRRDRAALKRTQRGR